VPLDYVDPSIGTIAIAFVKHSAPNASAETREILYNPGGPGESGVDQVLSSIDKVRSVIGYKHDIVGFDPRGVNNSGPNTDCFQDPTQEAIFGATYIPSVDGTSPQSMSKLWALAGAYGDWCSVAHMNDSAKYVSTSAIAQDMLRYTDVSYNSSDSKLWYYGFSYGTVLGITFASLFPDRVGRWVLDGVVDTSDWYAGTFKSNAEDVDKIIANFFFYCHKAGPSRCAFYASSPEEISQRLRNLLETIRREPIPLSDRSVVPHPITITYEVMAFALLSSCYQPRSYWPGWAQILADLENKNATSIAQRALNLYGPFGSATLCLDSAGRYNLSSPELFSQHVDYMKRQSEWAGEGWLHPLECRQLTTVPPPSQQFFFNTTTNRTDFDIVFLSNTLDPVAPLSGARRMQARFPGSVMLVQNAEGHTSTAVPSNCTSGYVWDHFDGTAPPPGTTCQPNTLPFGV
jgi:pimeloyl-ACP methyl ester carboxylesterase